MFGKGLQPLVEGYKRCSGRVYNHFGKGIKGVWKGFDTRSEGVITPWQGANYPYKSTRLVFP